MKNQKLSLQIFTLPSKQKLEIFYKDSVQFNEKYPARLESDDGKAWGFLNEGIPFNCPAATNGIFVSQIRADESGSIMVFGPNGNYRYNFNGGIVKYVTSGIVVFEDGSLVCPGKKIDLVRVSKFEIIRSSYECVIRYGQYTKFIAKGVNVGKVSGPDLIFDPHNPKKIRNSSDYFDIEELRMHHTEICLFERQFDVYYYTRCKKDNGLIYFEDNVSIRLSDRCGGLGFNIDIPPRKIEVPIVIFDSKNQKGVVFRPDRPESERFSGKIESVDIKHIDLGRSHFFGGQIEIRL